MQTIYGDRSPTASMCGFTPPLPAPFSVQTRPPPPPLLLRCSVQSRPSFPHAASPSPLLPAQAYGLMLPPSSAAFPPAPLTISCRVAPVGSL